MIQLQTAQDAFRFMSFLEETLDNVDYYTPTEINSGGCGVFAKILYDDLVAEGFQPTIYALKGNPTDSEDNEAIKYAKEVEEGNIQNIDKAGAAHIVLFLNGLYLDSNGIGKEIPKTLLMEMSYKALCLLVEKGKWNPTFDRSTIPSITQALKKAFDNFANWKFGDMEINTNDKVVLTPHSIKYKKMTNPLAGLLNLSNILR